MVYLPYFNSPKVCLGGVAMELITTTTTTIIIIIIIQDLSFPITKLLKNVKVLQKEQKIMKLFKFLEN